MSGILFAKYTPSALRLAMAMGPADPDLFETDSSMIDKLLEQAKPGLKFNKLAEFGTVFHPADPVVQFEHHDYRTPSGKIELTGSAFIDAGLPRAPFASAEARPGGGPPRQQCHSIRNGRAGMP